jgi:hypothetical protein
VTAAKWEPKRWEPATEYTGAGDYAASMQEDALGQWVDVDDARLAIEVRDQRIAALEAEVARLQAINDTLRSDRAWLAGLAEGAPIDVEGGTR